MGKLDELRRIGGGNSAESMGAGVARRSLIEGAAVQLGGPRYRDLVKSRDAFEVPVDRIVPDPGQPRKTFTPESLQDLCDSIRGRGLLQPIRVRWDEDREKYVVVAGERRWRATIMAGKATIACVIAEGDMTEADILHDQLVENCLRDDLKPIEQAAAFRILMDARGWTGARLAEELHIRASTVTKALALLELPGEIKDMVASGDIRPATAYTLSQLDRPGDQIEVARQVVAEGMTRDQVAGAVQQKKGNRPPKAKVEFRLARYGKLTLSGLPDDRPETVVAAAKEILKAAQAMVRDAARAEAEPGEQAA